MNFNLLNSILPLILLELTLLVFCVYVFLQVPKKYYLKLIMIPTAFFFAIASVVIFDSMLGYAYPMQLPDKFVLLAYNVVIKDGEKKNIEVWVKKKITRLLVVPYEKQLEKALKEAMKKQGDGKEVEMNKRKKPKAGDEKSGGDQEDYPFDSNIRLPHEIIKKDNVDQVPPDSPLEEFKPPKNFI